LKSKGFKQQLPFNLGGNIAYFLVNLAIGLLLVPYFLGTLGLAAYGLIPLATSLNGYVGLLTQSLNTAIGRYLTLDIQRKNYSDANKTFNTAFFGISGIILIVFPIVLVFSFLVPTIFNIPEGEELGAQFLFLGTMSAFLIRSWSGNFTLSLFANNRLDLLNLVNILNVGMQVFLIVIFFSFFKPSLAMVGLAYLLSAIFASILAVKLSRRLNPYLIICFKDFDRHRLADLLKMGSWVIINQVGSALTIPSMLIVVNILFGATSNGEFAIALQWITLLYAIGGMIAGVFSPVIFSYYAKGQLDMINKISKSAVKIMGIAIALPIGLICGFSAPLLTLWVGKEYSFLALLVVILTAHLTINIAVLPQNSVRIALNKVKIPGIVTLVTGIGNVLLAIFLSLYTDWGYYGVAISLVAMLFIRNALFSTWYTAHIMNVPPSTYVYQLFSGIIATITISMVCFTISILFPISSWASLILYATGIGIFYSLIIWFFGINKFERDLFSSYFPLFLKRILAVR
jgi:O-antigen/teichoic acid export membrane protein